VLLERFDALHRSVLHEEECMPGRIALRASPVFWQIRKRGAARYLFLRVAFTGVIDVPADAAFVAR
jgi:hypothetical protein